MRCFELFGRGDMEALLRHVDSAIETSEPREIPGAATNTKAEALEAVGLRE